MKLMGMRKRKQTSKRKGDEMKKTTLFSLGSDEKHYKSVPVTHLGTGKPLTGKGKKREVFEVDREYLPQLVKAMGTKKFAVSFVKKGDGSLRHMQSQRHVTKHINPFANPPSWSEDQKPNLRKVFETLNLTRNAKGQFVKGQVQGQYRTWDMDTVLELRGRGMIYKIL